MKAWIHARLSPAASFAGLAVVAFVAVACSERPTPRANAGAGPVDGGTLVVAAHVDLEFPNSILAGEVWTQEVNRYLLFLPLVRYDSALGYEPRLAESWKQPSDSTLVFRLRRGVHWHDGEPVDAYDLAFTFDRVKDTLTASPRVSDLTGWRDAQVVDSFTVRFRIDPDPDPLAAWVNLPIMPRHLLDTIPAERMRQAEFNRHPVGDGPFRFVSRTANDRWVFEANRSFPAELGGPPHLERVVWRVIAEPTAGLAELLTGQAQLSLALPADKIREVEAAAGAHVVARPTLKFTMIIWNGKRAPLGDVRVRRALTMGLDRQEIVDVLRSGRGEVAAGPVAPGSWAADSSLKPLPFDTTAARELLAEAGFRDRNGDGVAEGPGGRALAFDLLIPANNSMNRDLAQMIQAQLSRIGVKVGIRPQDAATLTANVLSPRRRFDAVLLSWETAMRPDVRVIFHSQSLGQPFAAASYANPAFDVAVDSAEAASSRATAAPYWRTAQRILRDEEPWTFLYYYPDLFGVRDELRGVDMDIRGAFRGIDGWWLAVGDSVAAATP